MTTTHQICLNIANIASINHKLNTRLWQLRLLSNSCPHRFAPDQRSIGYRWKFPTTLTSPDSRYIWLQFGEIWIDVRSTGFQNEQKLKALVSQKLMGSHTITILQHISIKNKQNYFCYNYVKLPPNLTFFGTKMANSLKLYEVHSFSTSPNSCQCTTVLNVDVPNCHITL